MDEQTIKPTFLFTMNSFNSKLLGKKFETTEIQKGYPYRNTDHNVKRERQTARQYAKNTD